MQINNLYGNFSSHFHENTENPHSIQQVFAHNIDKMNDAYQVSISQEGREKLKEMYSANGKILENNIYYKDMSAKSIVDVEGYISTDFHSYFKEINTQYRSTFGRDCTGKELMANCAYVYSKCYDEIKRGYAEGGRELYVADKESEGGFRKITEAEELSALDKAFEFYSQTIDAYEKYGRGTTEKIEKYQEELYADIEAQQKRNAENMRDYELKERSDNVYKRLMNFRSEWKKQYHSCKNFSEIFQMLVNGMYE